MPALAALHPCVPVLTSRQPGPAAPARDRRYRGRVPVPANLVAAALREHLPHAAGQRLHRLMYYVQGHHLALHGRPAFTDDIAAGVNGPEIRGLNPATYQPGTVGDSIHAVALLVAARYGGLTGQDLDNLTRAETPWRGTVAHRPGDHIPRELMREYFAGPGRQDGADRHTPTYLKRVAEEVTRAHTHPPEHPDDLASLLAKVAGDER